MHLIQGTRSIFLLAWFGVTDRIIGTQIDRCDLGRKMLRKTLSRHVGVFAIEDVNMSIEDRYPNHFRHVKSSL